MKAIMVMFDSLNRHMLPPYGCEWTHAPNFAHLAQKTLTFDRSYVCSMPCMPARRDLHTGRPNFLHCPWSPLQPFDDSMPAILQGVGVYTHLCSDHFHYWEDGGATYHTRYNSWEFFRGQEGDAWMGQVAEPPIPKKVIGNSRRQDWVNRQFMATEPEMSQPRTFAAGLEFIERNHGEDNWFLQIECFDPHEPFFAAKQYQDLYPHEYDGAHFDWPAYRAVSESPEEVEHCRLQYAALLSMCDAHLGRVLDAMDRHNMWQDTMLIVWTDHGFLLGEHGCWAKNWMPLYRELSNTPFFVWDPRSGIAGERRRSLVQPSIDLAPTLLNFFGAQPTPDMLGHDLAPVIERDAAVRQAAIFGYFGQGVNITDGRYVYMREPVTPDNRPLGIYSLMPTVMRGFLSLEQLQTAELAPAFAFTKGCRPLKMDPLSAFGPNDRLGRHTLWDLEKDPGQTVPITHPEVENRLLAQLEELLRGCDAPAQQYQRLGLRTPVVPVN